MNIWLRVAVGFVAVVALAVFAFAWNEARMEVKYLCGNFAPGVSEQSVIRQLDTGNFLRYRFERREGGRRIIVDSALTLSIYRCVVDLDSEGRVVDAGLQ